MYPSKSNPSYGTFVHNSFKFLDSNFICISKNVILKEEGFFFKILSYLNFYIRSLFDITFLNYDFIYIHYLTHSTLSILPFCKFKKYIINIHGYDLIPETKYQKLLSIFNFYILKNSKLIIVPSDYFKNYILNKYKKITPDKIIVNYSGGVDNQLFNYTKNDKLMEFTYIGRIDKNKGLDFIVDSAVYFKRLNIDLVINIYGTGKNVNFLNEQIVKFNLQNYLKFHGAVEHNLVPKIINNSKFLLFPTKRESLGLIAIESISCGVPVITYNEAPMNTYISDGYNGFLFDKYISNSFIEKILYCRNINDNIYKKISKNAILSSIKFESNLLNYQLLNLLKNI